MKPEKLTHLDSAGEARMVDVGGKEAPRRVAKAGARIRMRPAPREQLTGAAQHVARETVSGLDFDARDRSAGTAHENRGQMFA